MLHLYDYKRYVVFIKLPGANIDIPKDYDYPIVGGSYGRVLNEKVKPRALFTEEAIFGKEFAAKLKITLDAHKEVIIPEGASWESLYL